MYKVLDAPGARLAIEAREWGDSRLFRSWERASDRIAKIDTQNQGCEVKTRSSGTYCPTRYDKDRELLCQESLVLKWEPFWDSPDDTINTGQLTVSGRNKEDMQRGEAIHLP